MQAVIDDILTNYEDKGQGKTVLLLHGWGDSLDTFQELKDRLSNQYRVIALDLPGFGKTEMPKTTWGLEDYAEFISHFLMKIQISEIFAIIGHSNGGAIAIKAVSNNKLQPTKLVLLASSGIRDKNNAKKLIYKTVAKTGNAATFWLSGDTRKKLRIKLYTRAGSDILVAPHLETTFKKTISQDIQADAKKINVPTLLIYGQIDNVTPVKYGEILSKLIPNSKLEVLPGAGHFVHHDSPQNVTKLIENFLNVK